MGTHFIRCKRRAWSTFHALTTCYCRYGLAQTLAAIEGGAAAMVILSEDFATQAPPPSTATTACRNLKEHVVALCKEQGSALTLVKNTPCSPGLQLCKDYGGICVSLRWAFYFDEEELARGSASQVTRGTAQGSAEECAAKECDAYTFSDAPSDNSPSPSPSPPQPKHEPGPRTARKAPDHLADSDKPAGDAIESWEELDNDVESRGVLGSNFTMGRTPASLNPTAVPFVPRGF